jgi:hypothetical protein
MKRGRPRKQKEEHQEVPAVLPSSSKVLRALREDIMKHHKVQRQLDMDHVAVEDLNITMYVNNHTSGSTPALPCIVPLYRAASDRYHVHVDQQLKPIRFSITM